MGENEEFKTGGREEEINTRIDLFFEKIFPTTVYYLKIKNDYPKEYEKIFEQLKSRLKQVFGNYRLRKIKYVNIKDLAASLLNDIIREREKFRGTALEITKRAYNPYNRN